MYYFRSAADFAARVLENGPNPHNGKKTDKAHPPIHPLKTGAGLSDAEGRIFELITRHFLACLSANALGQEVEVEIEIQGEAFEAKGLTILERNYLEVYIYDRWSDKVSFARIGFKASFRFLREELVMCVRVIYIKTHSFQAKSPQNKSIFMLRSSK